MITIGGMLSMAGMAGDEGVEGMHDEMRRIHENLLFYDEHTFGAAESISDPQCENSQVQWAEKGSYVWEALKSAQMLYETSIGRLQGDLHRSERPTLTFFNPLGWERSALTTVYIDFEVIPRDRAVPSARRAGPCTLRRADPLTQRGTLLCHLGRPDPGDRGTRPTRWCSTRAAPPSPRLSSRPTMRSRTTSTAWSSIPLRAASARSWTRNWAWSWSMAVPNGNWATSSTSRSRVTATRWSARSSSATAVPGLRDVRFTGATTGDIYTTVSFRGTAEGCDPDFGVRVEVRLYNDVKRIDLHYAARRLPETDPSGLYVAFPFALEGGRLAFDVPGGVVYAGENQIPGTTASWNTVQNFVSVRNDRAQILVSCDAMPLFMMGELLNDPYRQPRTYEKPHLFSWVTNNYWTTNFRASQEGELNWSYTLTSCADTSNAEASAFGWGNRIPLYARVMPAAGADNGKGLVEVVLPHGLRPCADDLVLAVAGRAGRRAGEPPRDRRP